MPASTTAILQEFINEKFDIDYSQLSRPRIINETSLTYQTSREAAVEVEPEGRDDFEQEIYRSRLDAKLIYIDPKEHRSISNPSRRGYPEGEAFSRFIWQA